MTEAMNRELAVALGLDDLNDPGQQEFFNNAAIYLMTGAVDKAMSLLTDSDLAEYEKLSRLPDPEKDREQIINFLLVRDIDFTQIYKEELIKFKIFLRKRSESMKLGEVKEELFDDVLLENGKSVITQVARTSETASLLLDAGTLALNIMYNPSKKYSTPAENRARIIDKTIKWALALFLGFVLDFLLYFIPYLLQKHGVISKVPNALSALVPDFLIELTRKLLN